MKYTSVKYNPELKNEWDEFILKSHNGTFLHLRNYIEYHADRFTDFSVVVYNNNDIVCLLPAHQINNEIFSHNGLTYGDFIFSDRLRTAHKIEIIESVLIFLNKQNFTTLHIKNIPYFFHHNENQINEYLLYQSEGKLSKVKPFFVLNTKDYSYNKDRKKNLKKLHKIDFSISKDIDYLKDFWQIVEKNLEQKYQTKPVHSLKEITGLSNMFPEQINLFSIWYKEKMLAGTLVFHINNCLHFQYIHSYKNSDYQLVDALIDFVINTYKKHYKYISFGSSEEGNNNLNNGLTYWKESFGTHIYNQTFYSISTSKFSRLKNILQ